MLEFSYITLDDIKILRPYFNLSMNRACDNTCGSTFMWRDYYETQCAIAWETMVLKVKYFEGVTAFTFPLGENIPKALEEIEIYCKHNNMPMTFCSVTEENKEYLSQKYNINYKTERDWYDYLYLVEDLYHLAGRKYSGQRNHINNFKKNYPSYEFEHINESNVAKVKEFYKNLSIIDSKSSELFYEEQGKVFEVLDNFSVYGMRGGFISNQGEIISFALGEIVYDTLFVHIEKANTQYRGAYQMIVNEFVRNFAGPDIFYVNREDDAGDEGLRISKTSYHPVKLIEKYTVIVNF